MLRDLEAFLRYVTLIAVRFYFLTYGENARNQLAQTSNSRNSKPTSNAPQTALKHHLSRTLSTSHHVGKRSKNDCANITNFNSMTSHRVIAVLHTR